MTLLLVIIQTRRVTEIKQYSQVMDKTQQSVCAEKTYRTLSDYKVQLLVNLVNLN